VLAQAFVDLLGTEAAVDLAESHLYMTFIGIFYNKWTGHTVDGFFLTDDRQLDSVVFEPSSSP
jgi:hypothetical protein